MSQAAADKPARRFIPSLGSLDTAFWVGPLDLRAIAMFRIGLGMVILYDLLDLLPDVPTFFSDVGVMPRTVLLTDLIRANRFALSDAFGTPEAVYVYWVLAFLAVLSFTVGYRTRVAQFVAYVFVAGFNERLPQLFDGSDSVIRLTLFWLCWCPSGNRYSVDAVRAHGRGRDLAPLAMALPIRLVQLQIAWVYLCSYLHKLTGRTWHNGTALHYVLHLNHVFARPWTSAIADDYWPMQIGTWFTLCFESSFLFLTFSPVFNRYLRPIALIAGTMLHLGIAFTVNVGIFSYLMPVSYLVFLEPTWIEWGIDRLRALCTLRRLEVVYDGNCADCRANRARLEVMDRFAMLRFIDFRKDEVPAAIKSSKALVLERGLHVVTPSGEVLFGWPALATMYRRFPSTFAVAVLMQLPIVFGLGSWLAARAIDRRHALQASGAVPPPAPVPLFPASMRRWASLAGFTALTVLFLSTAWYAAPSNMNRDLPRPLNGALQWFSLWNVWDMFAPEPLRTDYHLRAIAEYSDGSTEDLFGGPVDGPGEVRGFWFHRWWKYLENVTGGGETLPREWGKWECREHNWKRKPGVPMLYTFTLKKENQIIPPMDQPWPPVQTNDVWIHRCYDKK